MKMSKRGEYGMRALCHLAEHYGEPPVQIGTIAAVEEIPSKFLEGILLELNHAGFVISRRGSEGGYTLSRPPAQIFVGAVLRALDGPLAPLGSAAELLELQERHPRRAGLYAVLTDVRNAIAGILDRTSLADLLHRNLELRRNTPPAEAG